MSTADVQLANLLRLDWSAHAPRPELGEDDWDDVVCKALHHGVAGLLCRVITARQVDASRATANAARAYLIHAKREGEARVRATFEIVDTLRGDGIEALALKGIALGALAHDDARLRPSGDIDVLVRHQDMARAVASLARVGYRQTDQLSEGALAACYATYGQEILFAPGRLPVEPHWTFVPRPFSVDIDVDAMWRRRMPIELEGRILETLSIEDTLLVACLHGAKERWWRLLWVADIAGLIARRPAIDWDAITAQATKSRIVRILHLGLGLTNALFATPLPHRIERAIASDGTCRRLIDESKRNLAADRAGREALLRVSRFHLAARERLRDRVRYVTRTITTPRFVHYRMIALPDALAFGYVPVKLVHDYLLLPIWLLGKGRLWRRKVEVRKSS